MNLLCLHIQSMEVDEMGIHVIKPVFGVSDKARLKPVSSATETSWKIENCACSKSLYDTFQKANNKCADQSVRMRRLVCAFVVRKPPKTGFLVWKAKLSNKSDKSIKL